MRRQAWEKLLGSVEPPANPQLIEGKAEEIAGAKVQRFAFEVERGIVVPFLLLTPKDAKPRKPVIVMVAQGGKTEFLKERSDVIETFLKAGFVVCLVDVRGRVKQAQRLLTRAIGSRFPNRKRT